MGNNQDKKQELETVFIGWLKDRGYVRRPHNLPIAIQEDSADLLNKFIESLNLEESGLSAEEVASFLSGYVMDNEPWFAAPESLAK